jgi:putative ABC transport system permease protein
MASYMAEQRFKEIGIRKTLGASVPNILVLISKDVVKLIIIANIIALPIAYYVFHRWLESFAYRTRISALIFLISAALVFFIGYSTIAYQSIKAALLNPVDAIRTE